MNKETARSEFVLTAAGYPVMIVPGARLPEVHAGDVVALLEAGAYQEISASNFNALSRPATVLVNGRDAEIVKRAETVEDVWARDVVPARFQRARETAEAARPGGTPT